MEFGDDSVRGESISPLGRRMRRPSLQVETTGGRGEEQSRRSEEWTRASHGVHLSLLAVVAVWIVYGIYETIMYFWMQTVIAPIRVDLLLIVPVLYLVTLVGLIAAWGVGRTRSETS